MAELSSRLASVQAPDREEWRTRYVALGRRSESAMPLSPAERAEFALLDVVIPQLPGR
jgi:YD repeat-containing protein